MSNSKIDLVIVGAQKAGTTSLLRYLGEHPGICAHPQKEFAFFFRPMMYSNDFNIAFAKYFTHFNPVSHKKIIAKSAALYTEREGLLKLYDHNPSVKVVFILRDPVERTYSAYMMEKNAGEIDYDFATYINMIEDKNNPMNAYLLKYNNYVDHLKTIYEIFPKENVRVVLYEELKSSADTLCSSLFSWLGVSNDFHPATNKIHNQTLQSRSGKMARVIHRLLSHNNPIKRGLMLIIPRSKAYRLGDAIRRTNLKSGPAEGPADDSRQKLRAFFHNQVEELEKLLNKELTSWK
jgi:hypothetical protein